MKAAVVVYADSRHLGQAMAELDELLAGLAVDLESVEMWVVCQKEVPGAMPRLRMPLHDLLFLAIDCPAVPEAILHGLVSLQTERRRDLLLFSADQLGQELATRLAFRLGGSSAVNVERCSIHGPALEISRRAYGSNLIARLHLDMAPYCLSVARQPVEPATAEPVADATVVERGSLPTEMEWLREWHFRPDPGKTDLAGADVVLALGSGIRTRDELAKLQEIAEALGAEIGVSRPVAMNGWLDMSRLIGASGQILSPRLCIAAGVSGSAVFSCGVENSRFLVAINTDSQAEIFAHADVGIVDDLFVVLAELATIVRNARGHSGSS